MKPKVQINCAFGDTAPPHSAGGGAEAEEQLRGAARVMVPSSALATPIDGWSASSPQTTAREVLAAAIGAIGLLFGLVSLSIIPTKIDSDDLPPQQLIGTGCPNFWNAIGLGSFVVAMCITFLRRMKRA